MLNTRTPNNLWDDVLCLYLKVMKQVEDTKWFTQCQSKLVCCKALSSEGMFPFLLFQGRCKVGGLKEAPEKWLLKPGCPHFPPLSLPPLPFASFSFLNAGGSTGPFHHSWCSYLIRCEGYGSSQEAGKAVEKGEQLKSPLSALRLQTLRPSPLPSVITLAFKAGQD